MFMKVNKSWDLAANYQRKQWSFPRQHWLRGKFIKEQATVALWTEAKLGNRRESVAIPNRRPPEEAIVCPEVELVKGEDHKGVGNNSSEDKSKIKYNKDTDNSITKEVVSTSEATQAKTVLKDTKPDRPETAQVEAANNS